MARVRASVVVPVKDRRERMLECLEALLAQDHPSYEIVIVDNESSDGTAAACRARAAQADVPVRVEVVAGSLGHVRNEGARLAEGEVIAFVDSDCNAAPSWLRKGAAAFEADPRIGVACGRTVLEETPTRPWPRGMQVLEFTWRFETCNAFYRAAALRDSDGFDDTVGDGWEDTAAGYAVLGRGWRPAFVPEAVVTHDVSYPGFSYHVRREQRQVNAARIVRRYPEVRRRQLYAGFFLERRSAGWFAAAVGLALGTLEPRARVLALPYAAFLLRRVRPRRMAEWTILDGAMHVALLRGAVRHRCLIL